MQNSSMNKPSIPIRVVPPKSRNREDEEPIGSISATCEKGKAVVVREKEEDSHNSSMSPSQETIKNSPVFQESEVQVNEAESSEMPTCSVCNRPFKSEKALFGHMRMHSGKPMKKRVIIGKCEGSSNSKWLETGKGGREKAPRSEVAMRLSGDIMFLDTRMYWEHTNKVTSMTPDELPSDDVTDAARILMSMSYESDWQYSTQNSKRKRVDRNEGKTPQVFADIGIKCKNNQKRLLQIVPYSGNSTQIPVEKPSPKAEESVLNTKNSAQISDKNLTPTEKEQGKSIITEMSISLTRTEKEKGKKIFTANSNDKESHVCGTCGMSFDKGQALGGHMTLHKKEKPKLRERRVINKKISDKEHKCKICSREFPTGQELGGHMRAHRNAEGKGIGEPSSENAKEKGEVVVMDVGENDWEDAQRNVGEKDSGEATNDSDEAMNSGENYREKAQRIVCDFDLNEMTKEENEDNY